MHTAEKSEKDGRRWRLSAAFQFTCPCLNVRLLRVDGLEQLERRSALREVNGYSYRLVAELAGADGGQSAGELLRPLFRSAVESLAELLPLGTAADCNVILRCLLCGCDCALLLVDDKKTTTDVYVNVNCLEGDRIDEKLLSDRFLKSLGVLLPAQEQNPTSAESSNPVPTAATTMPMKERREATAPSPQSLDVAQFDVNCSAGEEIPTGVGVGARQLIRTTCSDYLRREQEAMEARIRAFVVDEQRRFEGIRAKVKTEKEALLFELSKKRLSLEAGGASERDDKPWSGAECLGRQRSGGDESATDSAVPLSPVSSLTASMGETSPALPPPSNEQNQLDSERPTWSIGRGTQMQSTTAGGGGLRYCQQQQQQQGGAFFPSSSCSQPAAESTFAAVVGAGASTAATAATTQEVATKRVVSFYSPNALSEEEDTMFSLDEDTDDSPPFEGGRRHFDAAQQTPATDADDEDTDYDDYDSGGGDDVIGRLTRPLSSRNGGESGGHGGRGGGAAENGGGGGRAGVRQGAPVGAGLLVSKFGTSLPVTIPNARYWPPEEAVDSYQRLLKEREENKGPSEAELNSPKLFQRGQRLHEEMRSLARSIQAADDPERLFGERPQRRRYKTGEVAARLGAALEPPSIHATPQFA